VLILKEVKVVCFDTLLQVLILKVDMGWVAVGETNGENGQQRAKIEGKDDAETQSWRSDREERGMPPPVSRRTIRDTIPRVFWEKRLQAIENKRRRSEKERQEISRGGKSLMDRGLESTGRNGSARFVRDNIRKRTTDLDVCQ
jgi:hypothetical protein